MTGRLRMSEELPQEKAIKEIELNSVRVCGQNFLNDAIREGEKADAPTGRTFTYKRSLRAVLIFGISEREDHCL